MQPVELPTFAATWWPLQMETIPGSGEIITVAILARAASGQSQVRQSVQPAVLTGLFGLDTGRGVNNMVGTTVVEAQRQLDEGVPTGALELPFGGFRFGPARDCVTRDLNEVFDVAVRLSAAFGHSAFGQRGSVIPESSREAFDDWAERVREQLLAHEARIALEATDFNVKVRLGKKLIRFGLLRTGYAANFGVLRPGHTAGDIRSLKVKLFDLEALCRDQILPMDKTDAIVGCSPPAALSAFPKREQENYYTSLNFIEREAQVRRVNFIRCADPEQAARHIGDRLRAA